MGGKEVASMANQPAIFMYTENNSVTFKVSLFEMSSLEMELITWRLLGAIKRPVTQGFQQLPRRDEAALPHVAGRTLS